VNDDDKTLFDRLRERGEEVLGQISGELMQNEHFMKALQGALEGKQRLDQAVGRAMKTVNVPTRSEVKRAVSRIESLESEVAALKEKLKAATGTPARRAAAKATPQKAKAKKR
jgi:polyhydroxyalkanoate synthesis regulator phasin